MQTQSVRRPLSATSNVVRRPSSVSSASVVTGTRDRQSGKFDVTAPRPHITQPAFASPSCMAATTAVATKEHASTVALAAKEHASRSSIAAHRSPSTVTDGTTAGTLSMPPPNHASPPSTGTGTSATSVSRTTAASRTAPSDSTTSSTPTAAGDTSAASVMAAVPSSRSSILSLRRSATNATVSYSRTYATLPQDDPSSYAVANTPSHATLTPVKPETKAASAWAEPAESIAGGVAVCTWTPSKVKSTSLVAPVMQVADSFSTGSIVSPAAAASAPPAVAVTSSSLILGHYRCLCGVPLCSSSSRIPRQLGGFVCFTKVFSASLSMRLVLGAPATSATGVTSAGLLGASRLTPHASAHFAAACTSCHRPIGYVTLDRAEVIAADTCGPSTAASGDCSHMASDIGNRYAHVLRLSFPENVTWVGGKAPPEYRDTESTLLLDADDGDDDEVVSSAATLGGGRRLRRTSFAAAQRGTPLLQQQATAYGSSDDSDDDTSSSEGGGDESDDDAHWQSMRSTVKRVTHAPCSRGR